MSDEHPLFGSIEKLKAADRKITDLKASCNAFIASKPYKIRFHDDGEFRHCIVELANPFPAKMRLDVGEISVQLRDSLDKLVVAMVIANGRGTSGVSFPFGGKDQGTIRTVPNAYTQALENKLTADQWKFVVAQKPYPGGNDTLWGVNQIANADKHWNGLVALRAKAEGGLTIPDGARGPIFIGKMVGGGTGKEAFLNDQNREAVIFSISNDSYGQMQPHVTGTIVFGEIEPVAARDILITLDSQFREVKRVVELAGKTFF